MNKCLVTGGAGFIGSHLVDALLAQGHHARVLDDLSNGLESNLRSVRSQIEWLHGSVANADLARSAVEGCDCVFHLAALPSVARSIVDPLPTHEACATGTLTVLRAAQAAGVRRVVYAGSSSAYGSLDDKPRSEEDPVWPQSPYAAAKLAGEHYCQCFTACYGLETVRLRFFNIFGPRQRADSPYSGVIALFVRLFSEGQAPTIHGDGLQSRDFTYVSNAVQALCQAGWTPGVSGNVYNIGMGQSISLLELVHELNGLFGVNYMPRHVESRPGDVRHSRANIYRAVRELGYLPSISFAEGLRRLTTGRPPQERDCR